MKYIFIFIQALAIAMYHLFFGDPVTLSAKVPENANQNEDFEIEVVINKAQVTGFAKLQLELPQGLFAKEIDSKGGSFSASGTIVKIIWTSIPADEELVVKVGLKASGSSAGGNKTISGKFSYIENNVKQQVEFDPVTVTVAGGEEIASTGQETAVPSSQETPEPFEKPAEPSSDVTVSRKATALDKPNSFKVDVIIKKGSVAGFAKLLEKIPEGFTVTEKDNWGSVFESGGGEAKFIWTSIPVDEEITITYLLTPNASVSAPVYIEGGEFSYIENEQSKTARADRTELPVNTDTQMARTEETAQPVSNEPTATPSEPVAAIAVAPGNANVHYSVQIGAFRNGVNAAALGSRYSIAETVRTEMHEGFTKCIVGKYNEYKAARNNRETIKGKGVTDAFVTAYNSGKRITVQEALMTTNQKWYK